MTHSQPLLNPVAEAQSRFHNLLDTWIERQVDAEPVQSRRLGALARFSVLDLPKPKDEDWKYTKLTTLWKQLFHWHDGITQSHTLPMDRVDWLALGTVLTFVDGVLSHDLSTPDVFWPEGVSIRPMMSVLSQDALGEDDQPPCSDAMQALAKASMMAGVYIHVKAGVVVDKPIVIRQLGVKTLLIQSLMHRVVLEQGAVLMVIEDLMGAEEGLVFSQWQNSVGQNAQFTHLLWQQLDVTAHAFSWRDVTLARDARFVQRALCEGAFVSRQQMTVRLEGENAESDVATGVIAMTQQTQDVRTHTRHDCMHARSRQLHRFAIGGQANGVFHGDILVEKGADKTDANMATNNLLLSPRAQANSKPQLEIYADDVRCTHGVTSGNVDEAQIFYLRARGIPAAQAKLMISAAFAKAALEDVTVDTVREAWQQAIADKLQRA
jgi:Fe-S cluster assembly protein SufD